MNIDKDIDFLKGKLEEIKCEALSYDTYCYEIKVEDVETIENVLLRLEEWEKVHNLINESAVRIDNTPTTSTLEVDLNKLFTHIGFLDNATLVNIKLKNTTRYKVELDSDKSELERKECYLIQQDDENSNWYKCSNCKQEFYWGETVDDMKRSSIKYCNFCGSKIKEVVYMEDEESEEKKDE